MSLNLQDSLKQFEAVKKISLASVEALFPVKGKKRELILVRAWFEDHMDPTDYKSQSKEKANEGTWGTPLYAHLRLIEKGRIIDENPKAKLLLLPKVTQRHSYIVGGNEYQVQNQLRLRPGVYIIRKQNGEIKTQINLEKGKNFDITFNELKGLFFIQDIIGSKATIPLYQVLGHLGISKVEIAKYWGEKITQANALFHDPRAIEKLESALKLKSSQTIKSYFNETKIDKETTKIVLGKPFEKVDPFLLLTASRKLLQVHMGKEEATDRDSLQFKELHSLEDFIKERLEKNKNMLVYRVKRNIDNTNKVKISQLITSEPFNSVVHNFFLQDDKSSPSDQTNPVEMVSGTRRLTVMGAGGIGTTHAITSDMRQIHSSHFGLIDPVHTPSGAKIGVNTHMPIGAIKEGKSLKTRLIDKAGKEVYLDSNEMASKRVAFPDEKGARVKVLYKGQVEEVPRSRVDYFVPSSSSLFSHSTNLIPFLSSTQGNRAEMASKMMEQAIGLKYREAPLVQSYDPDSKRSFESVLGDQSTIKSPVTGTVKEVTSDTITLAERGGKVTKINLYNNFALNKKSFIHHHVKVKKGDTVKVGDLLADSNYTSNGTLALGVNLKTAYLAHKGDNFDDGIVVSAAGAKKLTSEHLYTKNLEIYENTITGLAAYKSFYPMGVKPKNLQKLDSDGVIKQGSTLEYGETLVVAMQKRAASAEIGILNKVLSEKPRDISLVWTLEDSGEVLSVTKTPKKITVVIKTEEAAKIGDKITNRHGGKGVISKILPDNEMPHTKDGSPVDVVLSPMGIISRINISQTYDSSVGKAAAKKGTPFVLDNFDGSNNVRLAKDILKKTGVEDKEILIDPSTGKSLGKVHVGIPHILKLSKQSQGNYSVRQGGPGEGYDANMQPLKAGGEEGAKTLDALTMYSMLSHGARANLREMSSIKSTKNDEFWKALKAGELLPPPKVSFAFDKFTNYLRGAGIDTQKNGTQLTLMPFTDQMVKGISKGEIKRPVFYRGKDFSPIKGGFFDPQTLGGLKGSNWGHMTLKEPVVNPPFEDAARKLTGLGKKFDAIVNGELFLNARGELSEEGKGLTGGAAIEKLLSNIDPKREIQALLEKAKRANGTALDDINKKLRYLTALQKLGLSPQEAYIRRALPVLPPQFRPIYPLPDGQVTTSDSNVLYQNTGIINSMMKLPVLDLLKEEDKKGIRKELYSGVKAVSGVGGDLLVKGKQRSGFISEIKGGEGGQPKEGFFISKLVSKKQDFVGRGTAIPETTLGIDDVEMPEEMAWKLFEPFIVRELKAHGKTPLKAIDEIKQRSALARRALDIVLKQRKVILNRAPSLHKFSVMAFNPKIGTGKTIKVQPLVNKGFNLDHDGDQQLTMILAFLPRIGISLSETQFMSRIGDKDMTARFREVVGLSDAEGDFHIMNLEDFPRGDLLGSKEGEKGRIDFHSVPEGVKVLSYDQESKRVEWKPVTVWSKHYQREIEVVTLLSGRQIVTDDDPRAVYGIALGELEPRRFTPSSAVEKRVLVPLSVRTEQALQGAEEVFKGMPLANFGEPTAPIYKDLPLTENLGHLIGSMVSNGWVETRHEVLSGNCFLSCVNETLGEFFLKTAKEIFEFKGKELRYVRPDGGEKAYGEAKKWGFLHHEASTLLAGFIELGAKNKHLPPFFLSANKDFRNGLFAGLMDHDGTLCVVHAKGKKPQLTASYCSASIRLIQEVQWLAKSLGVRSRITTSKTPAGEPFWYLYFSNIDIKRWGGRGMLNESKVAHLNNPEIENLLESAPKNDPVPMHLETAKALLRNIKAPRHAPPEHKALYSIIHKSKGIGRIGRATAFKILDDLPKHLLKDVPHLAEWEAIVRNTDVAWDPVESFERTGIKEDGYDLTVPGYETFTNVEGVVLSNTVTLHTPITDEANKEAEKMLPSRNLLQPGSGGLMIVPSQEAQLGLFYLAQTKKGREILQAILGAKFKLPVTMEKKSTLALLKQVEKEDPSVYAKMVKALKEAGDRHMFETGFTIGLDDIPDFSKQTASIVRGAKSYMSKAEDKSAANTKISQTVDAFLKKKFEGKKNPFYDQIASGAKGSPSQLRSLLVTPLFVGDSKGRVIANPISRSYAGGLTTADYWQAAYGVRKGLMDTSVQTSLPGAFSKDIMATVADNVISKMDCGTQDGITLPIDDSNALDRCLAGPQGGYNHNALVSSSTINALKKRGITTIKVRSPLKCKAAKGTCSHCFGLDEHGHLPEVGENVGAKSGQSISEPLVQLVMNTKHTGGIAGTGVQVGGYERISQLLNIPSTLTGSAALSPIDGKITRLVKGLGGGFDVTIGTVQAHISQGRTPKVAVGDVVKKGDALSDGPINPKELLALRGIGETQEYIANELHKTYKDQGFNITKKTFETIVRSSTDLTQVKNNPKHSEHLPGDITSRSVVEAYNSNLVKDVPLKDAIGEDLAAPVGPLKEGHELTQKDVKTLSSLGITTVKIKVEGIQHQPIIKGMSSIPPLKGDWMAGVGYRKIESVLTEGAAKGSTSDVAGYHPIPAIAYGVTFGKGKDGKY